MNRVYLKPGEIHVAKEPTVISTVLGSCISVFIYDDRLKIGGANHYVLPTDVNNSQSLTEIYNYGDHSILELLRRLKQTGSQKKDLRVKIVGGANIIDGSDHKLSADVGRLNITLAKETLSRFGLPILKEAVGGHLGRKVEFDTSTGQLRVKNLEKRPGDEATPPQLQNVSKPTASSPIKVMVIDDSRPIRLYLRKLIQEDSRLVVIAEAGDPLEAMEIRKTVKPDVITLDINMPKMDGITYLKNYMRSEPVPTILISGLTREDSGPVFDGLENGAFDYFEKPSFSEMGAYGEQIRAMIFAASESKRKSPIKLTHTTKEIISAKNLEIEGTIIAIGASTGGTEAIKQVLTNLPANIPPIVIVQHIPALFSKAFAMRLNQLCTFSVKEAESGDELKPGFAYIAPGGYHMRIKDSPGPLKLELTQDPPVNRFRPSVDYLFDSIKKVKDRHSSKHIIAALLTGMGADGARGLLSLRQCGADTIAQDEKTSVVFGMPREAIALGAACQISPLDEIAKLITHFINKKGHGRVQNQKVG